MKLLIEAKDNMGHTPLLAAIDTMIVDRPEMKIVLDCSLDLAPMSALLVKRGKRYYI